jgi:hypothetical protein
VNQQAVARLDPARPLPQQLGNALAPYPDDLVIVTKVGARRGEDASWLPA